MDEQLQKRTAWLEKVLRRARKQLRQSDDARLVFTIALRLLSAADQLQTAHHRAALDVTLEEWVRIAEELAVMRRWFKQMKKFVQHVRERR